MSFMGMGPLELVVVLLAAFLVLGPGRSIDLARDLGKMFRDLRRTFSDVTSAIDLGEDAPAARPPSAPPAPPASRASDGREEADLGGRR